MDNTVLQMEWEAAEIPPENENVFIMPDDGEYSVIFSAVNMENKTNAEKTQVYPSITWTFIINAGKDAGKKFRKFSDLKSKQSMGFFKGELKKILPAIPKNITDIVPAMSTVLRKVMLVNVKTYGETADHKPRKSVYVNGFSEGELPNYENEYLASAVNSGSFEASQPQSQSQAQPQTFASKQFYDDDVPF